MMKIKAKIMDRQAINRATTRIANEIIERNKGVEDLIFVGVKTRGVPFANKLAEKIVEIENVIIPVYNLDITMYRDDLSEVGNQPIVNEEFNADIQDKNIVLVDDVIYTGRTVRAALEALIKRGRPKKVQLAVLIDRGHRELPIRPDYVGKNVPTSKTEIVDVKFEELDSNDEVIIKKK